MFIILSAKSCGRSTAPGGFLPKVAGERSPRAVCRRKLLADNRPFRGGKNSYFQPIARFAEAKTIVFSQSPVSRRQKQVFLADRPFRRGKNNYFQPRETGDCQSKVFGSKTAPGNCLPTSGRGKTAWATGCGEALIIRLKPPLRDSL
jgi:hypothetical protein